LTHFLPSLFVILMFLYFLIIGLLFLFLVSSLVSVALPARISIPDIFISTMIYPYLDGRRISQTYQCTLRQLHKYLKCVCFAHRNVIVLTSCTEIGKMAELLLTYHELYMTHTHTRKYKHTHTHIKRAAGMDWERPLCNMCVRVYVYVCVYVLVCMCVMIRYRWWLYGDDAMMMVMIMGGDGNEH